MRNKLALQITVCVGISMIAMWGKNLGNPTFDKYYDLCSQMVMHQTTKEEAEAVLGEKYGPAGL